MLPAITFIFSRAACDDATRQCLQDGIRLTTPDERARIRHLTEAAVERLSDDDLRTLGYGPWSAALEAGIAPHHAGLVPAFRQAVEQCFSEGLLEGGVRHRDAGPRHQHAGPDGGGGAVRQVPGFGHLGPHLGGVPAAHRSGRPAGDRHRRPRLGPLVGRPPPSPWWPARPPPRRRTWSPPSTPPTTWRSTWSAGGRRTRPTRCWPPPTASGRPRRARSRWPPSSTADWPSSRSGDSSTAGGSPRPDACWPSIYHESDLLVAEALRQGLFDGLDARPLAGVASALTFEARRAGDDRGAPPAGGRGSG